MKKLTCMFILAFLLLIPASCSAATHTAQNPGNTYQQTTTATTTYSPQTTTTGSSGANISNPDDSRMIVRTGNMTMLVSDISGVINQITQLALQHAGYVVSSQSWQDNLRMHGTISIRVPAGDYDSIIDDVTKMAVAVTSQTTTSQDVTEEYVDLNSQLTNLQATEQQLLTIMQRAGTISEVLSVQTQLSNTRSQIEQTKGRMQYLQNTSSTSLLIVTLEQALLAATFTVQKTQLRAGETLSFTPEISGGVPPYNYQWDFGDGQKSTEVSPNHQYNSSGTYTVSLKVTDDRGNANTGTRASYVTVAPGWDAGNVAGSAWGGLIGLGRVLLDIIIWLGIFSPVWILGAGIPLYLRYRRKQKNGKKTAAV